MLENFYKYFQLAKEKENRKIKKICFKKMGEKEQNIKGKKKIKIKKNQKPTVVSNRKPFKPSIEQHKQSKPRVRDPRFSALSGELNPHFFRTAYKFLFDSCEIEKDQIEEKLRSKQLSNEERDKLKKEYAHLKNIYVTLKKKEEARKIKSELVKEEKQNILGKNKKPYYFSDQKIKKIVDEQFANKRTVKQKVRVEANILHKEKVQGKIPRRRYNHS